MKHEQLEILYKSATEFGTRTDVALHSLRPSYRKLLELIDNAMSDGFPRIVVYVDVCACWAPRFNCKASMSTWSRLMRDIDGDVQCGEVGFRHGRSDGDGFTIYFSGGAQ